MSKQVTAHVIIRKSAFHRYSVNGAAKRTNICPAQCNRGAAAQKFERLNIFPVQCTRGLSIRKL